MLLLPPPIYEGRVYVTGVILCISRCLIDLLRYIGNQLPLADVVSNAKCMIQYFNKTLVVILLMCINYCWVKIRVFELHRYCGKQLEFVDLVQKDKLYSYRLASSTRGPTLTKEAFLSTSGMLICADDFNLTFYQAPYVPIVAVEELGVDFVVLTWDRATPIAYHSAQQFYVRVLPNNEEVCNRN